MSASGLYVGCAGWSPETPVWCIFDSTALGAATSNALELLRELARNGRVSAGFS